VRNETWFVIELDDRLLEIRGSLGSWAHDIDWNSNGEARRNLSQSRTSKCEFKSTVDIDTDRVLKICEHSSGRIQHSNIWRRLALKDFPPRLNNLARVSRGCQSSVELSLKELLKATASRLWYFDTRRGY